jgi:hypothetical protein
MTACPTSPSPTPHPERVPPAAGPAGGGGGCCTGGGPPHGRVPAALPPPASGSRAGRPRRRGPAPRPSPSRPPTHSRPRRRGVGSGRLLRAAPRSGRWTRCQTATSSISPRWRRSASASRGRTAPPGQRRCGWCKRATRSSCGRSAAGAAAGTGGCVPTPTARSATEPIPTPCAPGPGRRHRGGGHRCLRGQVRRQPLRAAVDDRGGGRGDTGAGAPTVAIVAAGRRAPDPGPHQAGQGRPDPGRRPPLHHPHPTAPARTRTSSLRGDPSEAPVFGDRISRRRQSAELGHQLPAQARSFIAWLGSRRSGHGPTL